MPDETVAACVTLGLKGSAERAFAAWLSQKSIAQWMFGPAVRDEQILRISIEPRVGGQFSFLVLRGGTEIDHVGTYLILDAPHCLEFTWQVAGTPGAPSHVLVEFEAVTSTSCQCQLTHSMPIAWMDYVARVEASWTLMLEHLSKMLAG